MHDQIDIYVVEAVGGTWLVRAACLMCGRVVTLLCLPSREDAEQHAARWRRVFSCNKSDDPQVAQL